MKKMLEDLVEYGMYGTKRALFTTPMYYLAEVISGLGSSQSFKTRALAFGVNFFVAMPYNNWFRPKIYELMGITETSPRYKKDIANRVAFAAHQLPLYTGILVAAGASPEQIAITLPTGLAVGAATADKFQKFMDGVSNFIENKYYKTKERIKHLKNLSTSYAKNLALASLIAAMTKTGINYTINSIRDNNIITNRGNVLFVMDFGAPDGMYWINKKNFDSKKHALVFPEQ